MTQWQREEISAVWAYTPFTVSAEALTELAQSVAREIVDRMQVVKADGVAAPVLAVGLLTIDPRAYEAHVRGVRMKLKPLEFRVLAALVGNVGMVLSRERLLELAWTRPEEIASLRVVDVCICRVRAKLRAVLGGCNPIEVIHEVGYKLKRDLGMLEER